MNYFEFQHARKVIETWSNWKQQLKMNIEKINCSKDAAIIIVDVYLKNAPIGSTITINPQNDFFRQIKISRVAPHLPYYIDARVVVPITNCELLWTSNNPDLNPVFNYIGIYIQKGGEKNESF